MYRLANGTQVASLPTAPAPVGTPGFGTNGDPVAGVEASVFDAAQYNRIQEELVTVITTAGIALDPNVNNQLLQALQAMFLGGGSLGDPGEWILPGGLRIKWGSFATTTGDQDSVAFLTAFPNACIGVVANERAANGWTISGAPQPTIHGVSARTASGFKISSVRITPTGPAYGTGIGVFWIALGF